jgi:hypothetical protein
MVCDLIKQTRETVVQLKEPKEWAHGKAIQAAPKLGDDVTERRVLWMERDQNQRNKEEKVMNDDTLKWLSQMETELKAKNRHLFFLEHVRELCIVVLRGRKRVTGALVQKDTTRTRTHRHTQHTDAHTQQTWLRTRSHTTMRWTPPDFNQST